MILAGDIGGTKTLLALFSRMADGSMMCVRKQIFVSNEYQKFDELLAAFLTLDEAISSACFAVAGPVINQRCQLTNLSWYLDAEELKRNLCITKVKLLNDLEAMALGMLCLPEKDLLQLNPNAETKRGNVAVIAAGTGLGEAILYWDGRQYHAMATEGGHCDFAAQTPQQDRLLNFLRKKYHQHVSVERILSGSGFSDLYDFLSADDFAPRCSAVPSGKLAVEQGIDRNAVISNLGIDAEDALCAEVLRLFVAIYGAESGNLALKCLATGGVYIGGGIGPKIRTALEDGLFIQAFKDKGRFSSLLNKISIKLALNPQTPLIGASHFFAKT